MAKTIKRFTYAVKDKYDNMVTVYARIEKEGGLYYWYFPTMRSVMLF